MSLYEDLSQLAAGDLSPEAADALRARIAAEPEVAAAWRHLQHTLADLDALPDELAPPTITVRHAAPSRTAWVVAALAIAAAAVLWLSPRPDPVVLIADGVTWVDGQATVHAADAVVRIDGRARVEVEPPAGVARELQATPEDDMRSIVAALAGAAVTVAVYEGAAWVQADAGPGVEVVAGEVHATRPAPARATRPATTAHAPEPGETPAQTIARLAEALEVAEQALAEAEFVRAVASGQLAVQQGDPVPWPDDVPETYQPEAFEAGLREALADFPGTEVVEIACDEYPCLGAIRLTGDVDPDALGERLQGWVKGALGTDNLSMSLNRSRFNNDGVAADYVIFGAHSGDRDDDVGRRVAHRMDGIVDTLEQDLEDQLAEQDVTTAP